MVAAEPSRVRRDEAFCLFHHCHKLSRSRFRGVGRLGGKVRMLITSSAASAGRRSNFPSAYRYSMTMFFPSMYPSSLRPCRNASMRAGETEGEVGLRYAMRGIFVVCCASVGKQSAKSIALRVRTVIFSSCLSLCLDLLVTRHLTLAPSHLITLSALAKTFGGIVNPICFAAFKFTMNSNFRRPL